MLEPSFGNAELEVLMGSTSEFELRRVAVEAVKGKKMSVVAAASSVGRSEQWLHKWLRRFEADGVEGLADRSRAPKTRPTAIGEEVAARILEVRRTLEKSEFAGVGAEAILYELELEGFEPRPSKATVERVLARAGVAQKGRGRDRDSERHRPRPKAKGPGMWQQADWVGPRYLARRVRFSSIHLVDVGGGGAAAAQYGDERLINVAGFLTEKAWPNLGIPFSLQIDNAFSMSSPKAKLNPWNVFVRTCLFFGVEVVVSPPNELGWAQHVESFNGLWQNRTIRRHRYQEVADVQASSDRFCRYYNHDRPHPGLRVATHGTRFPAQLLQTRRESLRFPPEGFTVSDYQDARGRLHVPLARGRITFLRRVQTGGVIEVAGAPFFVPAATEGLCVAATILTSRRQLTIRLDGEIIARHPFPIGEKPASPYHPLAHRGLFYDTHG